MASKRRSKTVEILPIRTTRRAAATKPSRQVLKKPEDTKLISEPPKSKNVIKEIEKSKPITDKKPQAPKRTFGKKPRQKKIHKCGICSKIFKGDFGIKDFKIFFH